MLQIDAMILMGIVSHCQISQNSKLPLPLQHLEKEVGDEVGFLHADKHQSFLQVDFKNFGTKVYYKVAHLLLTGMIKHSESTHITSLQYPYNISKTKLGMELIFCM